MKQGIVVLDERDNVGVALHPLNAGKSYTVLGARCRLYVREYIAFGHKVALCDLAAQEPVRKYGEVIGHARVQIAAGSHVHTHNLVNPID